MDPMDLVNGKLRTVSDLCFCADPFLNMPLAWEHLTCYVKCPHRITSRNSDHDWTRYVNNLEVGTQGMNHGNTCVYCEARIYVNVLIYFLHPDILSSYMNSIILGTQQFFLTQNNACMQHESPSVKPFPRCK